MSYQYLGSTKEVGANRVVFGEAVNLVLDKLSLEEAASKVMVIDSKSSSSLVTSMRKIHVMFHRRFGGFYWLESHPSEAS
jgi:hypothetical protein